ncbi:MAG: GDP-mannose 4,6-dehydratase [Treponema sp.]|nr:GDP-mannose 4,6-dehydratase [Treponema sp.]
MQNKTVLITGVAGFIGSNLAKKLLNDYCNIKIVGIDNLNDYYDVSLKKYRLSWLKENSNFIFIKKDISKKTSVMEIFKKYKPNIVVNFAAQAGVRYSITNPDVYIESNIVGFFNILEACRYSNKKSEKNIDNVPVEHLIYASSSSVYGLNKKIPYSTNDNVDNPVSLYAATKKSNELLAHSYSKLYGIPTTGLRFFTVYGPAGRPDMAYFSFTNKLLNNETIKIFNYGNCKRDFTYIDDIVEGVVNVMKKPAEKNQNGVPYKIYNIGNNNPENLLDFVTILQEELLAARVLPSDYDFESHKELVPMQAGDVETTFADVSELEKDFGFKPSTPLRIGLRQFAQWYKEYYSK